MPTPPEPDSTRIRDPLIGSKLGEYQVVGPLGEGGMGVVYEGLHTIINKRVAIKVIKAEYAGDQVLVRRVLAEAQAVNAVRHRGIVDIHAHGTTPDGRPYLVMELLEGETVGDLLHRQRRLPQPDAIQLLFDATGPLYAAHKAGIVHRDLKPSNLFLCLDDDGERFLKLLDFGLAKRSSPGGTSSTMTSASLIVGTPDYMAPEQARAQPTDARTDIYALGVMAFEILSGKLPYTAASSVDLVMKHLTAPIPKLTESDPTIPEELSAMVERMMAKEPADRPQSLEPIRALLKQLTGRPATSVELVPRPSPVRSPPVTPAYLEQTQVRQSGPIAEKPAAKPSAAQKPPSKPSAPRVIVEDAPPLSNETLTGISAEDALAGELGTADTRSSLDSVEAAEPEAQPQFKTDPMRAAPAVPARQRSDATLPHRARVEPARQGRQSSSKVPVIIGASLVAVIGIGLAVVFGSGGKTNEPTPTTEVKVVTPQPLEPRNPPTVLPPVAAANEVDAGVAVIATAKLVPKKGDEPGPHPKPAVDPKTVDRGERPVPKPAPVRKPPTKDELRARIAKLRVAGAETGNQTINVFLNKYEGEIDAIKTADDAFKLWDKLGDVQTKFKLKVR